MIKERLSSDLRSKFIDSLEKTKATNSEHGFYMCSKDHEIVGSDIISGTDRMLNLGDPVIACKGDKVIGHFHTHNYGTLFKKTSKFMRPDMSDDDVKNFLHTEFEKYKEDLGVKELSIDSPSSKDLLKSLLYLCSDKPEGTMCVASDVGNNVECWTPKKISEHNCHKAYNELYKDGKEKPMVLYKNWMIPMFHKEKIRLADSSRVTAHSRLPLPAREARWSEKEEE